MGIFQLRSVSLLAILVLSAFLLLEGCRSDEPDPVTLIPEDGDPGIAVISPNNTRLLRRQGENVSVILKLLDNESLKLLRVVPRVFAPDGSLVGDLLPQDYDVVPTGESLQRVEYTLSFNAPNLDPFSKIQYNCYAIDIAGNSSATFFWVSIQPEPGAPEPFEILTYTDDTIYSRIDTAEIGGELPTNAYAFNFSSRRTFPGDGNRQGLIPQMDISENSQGPDFPWKPTLISPNNLLQGNDSSIFVITDSTRFNYDLATYTTIFEAFFSDPAPSATAPPTNHPIESKNKGSIEPGDIIIVRLIKTPKPQFAVMKITETFDEGPGISRSDFIRFDYKVTSP